MPWGFQDGRVVRAVEELVFSAGRSTKFVVVQIEGLLGGNFLLGGDDEVDATAGLGSEEVVDARGSIVRIEVEEGEGFFDTLGTWSNHSSGRREVAEGVGEDSHLDVELGAIGISAALGGGEIALFGFVLD